MSSRGFRRAILFSTALVFTMSLAFFLTLLHENDAAASSRNLLLNGNFEAPLATPWGTGLYAGNRPLWWNNGECHSSVSLDRAVKHGGSASLSIVNTSARGPHVYGTTAQRIAVQPGRRYRVSLWATGRNLASAGAVAVAVDKAWAMRPVSLPAGTFAWTNLSGEFVATDSFADIRIISEDRGQAWIDDMIVTVMAPPDPSPSAPPTSTAAMVPGLVWHGREWTGDEGLGWDFTFSDPEYSSGGVRYNFVATNERNRSRRGSIVIELNLEHGGRFQGRLEDNGGARIMAGQLVPSGSSIVAVGRSWKVTNPRERRPFWATIDTESVIGPPPELNLNTARVSELVAAGLSPRSARSAVEGRVVWGPYRNIAEALKAPGLSDREKRLLRERATVR